MKNPTMLLALSIAAGCGGALSPEGTTSTQKGSVVTTGTSSTPSTSDAGSPDAGSTPTLAGGGSGGSSGSTATGGGTLNGLAILSADSAWNEDISNAPVDPSSASYIANMSPTSALHPDFSNIVDGNYGIPFNVVDSSQGPVEIDFDAWGDQSDPGPYPIPLTAAIEPGGGDAHVLVVDTATKTLYELANASVSGSHWVASCGAKFDLTKGDLQRPDGWTSTDAAGLPVFPGLARADEAVDAGVIKHALRFTMVSTQAGYVAPAQHYASNKTSANLPPMGLRVRLKASVDLSKYGPQAKAILTALKTYGMILADNGSNWYITGAPDAKWDDDDLHLLGNIKGSDFEVVQHGAISTN